MKKTLLEREGQRLSIYIDESDRWRGKPLYAAILETLKSAGLAGATVIRGVAGFGAHSRISTASILRLSENLPLTIIVIDAPDKITQAVELVAPMVNEGLIILEEVQVIKYSHRYLRPLPADRPVEEVMTVQAVTVSPDSGVGAAWERMRSNRLKAMPVVDNRERVLGMVTEDDILSRSGVQERLILALNADDASLRQVLDELEQTPLTVAEVMTQPVITAVVGEPLGLVAARMAKGGLKRLPVVAADGRLVGILARVDILRQVTNVKLTGPRAEIPAGAAVTVADIMDSPPPTVGMEANLAEIIEALQAFQTRCLVVVDVNGRAVGLIREPEIIQQLQPPERRAWLQALLGKRPLAPGKVYARDVMSASLLTCLPGATLIEAVRLLLEQNRKWLVVVDEQDIPLGLVDRQILLGALT